MSVELNRTTKVMALILLGLLAVLVMPGLMGSGDSTAPPELVGTWTTDEPRYADRGFTIATTTLTIYRGEEQIGVYPIRSVRRKATPQGSRFDLDYGDGREPATFSVLYTRGEEATLQFPHQRGMEWRRTP